MIGNLGKDPEVRRLESGAVVARYPIATNENYKDNSGNWHTITEWHDIVAWRGLAERSERDLKKGSLVFVEGKIRKRKWQDRDGNDRYSTDIIAAVIRPLEKRETAEGGFSGDMIGGGSDFPSSPATEMKNTNDDSPAPDMDDDLPF